MYIWAGMPFLSYWSSSKEGMNWSLQNCSFCRSWSSDHSTDWFIHALDELLVSPQHCIGTVMPILGIWYKLLLAPLMEVKLRNSYTVLARLILDCDHSRKRSHIAQHWVQQTETLFPYYMMAVLRQVPNSQWLVLRQNLLMQLPFDWVEFNAPWAC